MQERDTGMSLDSINSNQEEEREWAVDEPGVISYALDALSELHAELHGGERHGAGVESPTRRDTLAGAPEPQSQHEPPQPPEIQSKLPDEGDERLQNLQSALDWYKDWLSSM
jgi:hypothetical protein